MDGAENNITALTTGRHGEVSKFFSQTEHQMVPDVLVISADKWASLKKPLQDALLAAAKESSQFQRTAWAEAEKDPEAVAAEKMGVKISSPAKAPFVAKVKPMMDEERKNAKIATLLDQIEATADPFVPPGHGGLMPWCHRDVPMLKQMRKAADRLLEAGLIRVFWCCSSVCCGRSSAVTC